MEIPVVGFMAHSEESEPSHSHDLYLISWDGKGFHVHRFSGVTSFDVGHRHNYVGTTEPAPSGVQHTHRYCTFTSFNDGHNHEIRGVTGPAIPLPGGRHYHDFCGVTTINGMTPHSHKFAGKTTP